MNNLTCIENYITKDQTCYGSFLIEPLEIGQGVTLGNALRRSMLSDLSGYAISGVRINNLRHEFSIVEGLREDVLEILLNLKEVTFKRSYSFTEKKVFSSIKGFLNTKGPIIVTAGMLKLPEKTLTILNPNQYICTILDNSEFYLEIDIIKGKGYKLSEERQKNRSLNLKKESPLGIDSLFMPIKKVNYKIKLIYDTNGNIKESLMLEILTNGSITPIRAIHESLKIFLQLISSLFLTANFFRISESRIQNKIRKS
jgi:DNA-directed RNA polymerase subunit alpha